MSEVDRKDIQDQLDRLAEDTAAGELRVSVCEAVSAALARLGSVLWVGGFLVGPDRVSRESPFAFGDDAAVGLATVAQIGGELGSGAVQLLKANNLYAGAALVRQVVEVEYLASAFAEGHEIAADWLRADRETRQAFWSPARLRERAQGRFLRQDYWHHCELGGHPTRRALSLLPNHRTVKAGYLWVDLAGHLTSIWTSVIQAAEAMRGGPVPAELDLPDVAAATRDWRESDGLYAALGDLDSILREDPSAFEG